MKAPEPIYLEPPPNPPLEDVQQLEPAALPITVPVQVMGPTAVRLLPARSGPAFPMNLGTIAVKVLDNDPKRSAATIIGDHDWLYRRISTGQDCPWPADVPLVITHCDSVWARVASDTAILTVITEIYAD